jgi:hypothetical protein
MHGTQSGSGAAQAYLPQAGLFGGTVEGSYSSQDSSGVSEGISHLDAATDSESVTTAPMLLPEEDTELGGVQFRPLDEQLYEVMTTMINQPAQQMVLKVLTGRPRTILTPTIPDDETPADIVREYEVDHHCAVPFCLPTATAERVISERTTKLLQAFNHAKFAGAALKGLHSSADHESQRLTIPKKQPKPLPALKPSARAAKPPKGPGGAEG